MVVVVHFGLGASPTRKGEQPLQKGDAGIDESWSRQLMQWSEPTALPSSLWGKVNLLGK